MKRDNTTEIVCLLFCC